MALAGWGGLGLLAALPLFATPAHERLYDGNRDEDDPCRMGLSQAKPHIEKPCNGGCWVNAVNQLGQAASIDKVAKRVIDGNQKDEEESRSPCAVDNAERQIGESDKCGKGKLVPCTSDLGVEILAMMVELVVCFLPAGERLAVDGDGAVVIGTHAMSIVLKRIDMHAARPHMHLFALALVGHMDAAPTNMDFLAPAFVSHMDAAPANMDLFAFVGINNVDAAREGNIDGTVKILSQIDLAVLGPVLF